MTSVKRFLRYCSNYSAGFFSGSTTTIASPATKAPNLTPSNKPNYAPKAQAIKLTPEIMRKFSQPVDTKKLDEALKIGEKMHKTFSAY